jgi:rusticyanin
MSNKTAITTGVLATLALAAAGAGISAAASSSQNMPFAHGTGMIDAATGRFGGGPMGSMMNSGTGSYGAGPMGGMMGSRAGTSSGRPISGMMSAGPSARMGAMSANAGNAVGSMLAGRAPQVISPKQARTLGDQTPAGGTVDPQNNTLTFHASSVHLTVIANPPYGHDMTFRIAGLTNPTIVVPTGARVTVQFINGDSDSGHGWMVTTAKAPLPYMPMVASGVAFPGAFAHPLGDPTAAGWGSETISFDASKSGQFTYLCPLPGHAQKGMHGQFIIQ